MAVSRDVLSTVFWIYSEVYRLEGDSWKNKRTHSQLIVKILGSMKVILFKILNFNYFHMDVARGKSPLE